MNQDVINSFREIFNKLRDNQLELEKQIKEETSEEVREFMHSNKFDESQAAVEYLRNLLNQIKFDFDFDLVETSINQFNNKMENLKVNKFFEVPEVKLEVPEIKLVVPEIKLESPKTEQVSTEKAFEPVQVVKHSQEELTSQIEQVAVASDDLLNLIKNKLVKNHFQIIDVKEKDLQAFKNKKNYFLTLVEKTLSKDEYFNILETKNQKKNIGFVFTNITEMQKAQVFADEWVGTSPEYKTKFLTINFTCQERLRSNDEELFEVKSY